jgi:hypothetical protein
MQTRKDCMGIVMGLVGDAYGDWLTEEYFSPLCNVAYQTATQYLEGTCVDETNVVPWGVTSGGGQNTTYPLNGLVKPRYVDFKPAGHPNNQFKPVEEFSILPDTPPQVVTGIWDIRVRGDFLPAPLTTDDSIIEIHPNAAHALAYSVASLIGAERPNDGWFTKYGGLAQNAWDEIAADITRQQQRLSFRIGSPNRGGGGGGRNRWGYSLQGSMGWSWRSYGLFMKMI